MDGCPRSGGDFTPDLVQAQATVTPVGVEGLQDDEVAFLGQGAQFVLLEVVNVAQALSASAPVEEIIAGLHLLIGQADALPGLSTRRQFGAVQELPLGMEEQSPRL